MGDVRDLRSAASLRRGEAAVRLGATSVVEREIVLPAQPRTPRDARHWVMHEIADAGVCGASNQVVELLTGETVANAVVHGPTDAEVRVHVRIDGPRVRVGVTDGGAGTPVVRHPEPTALNGRGLALVEVLASSWWTEPRRGGGKTVWFEVDGDE